MNKTFDELIEKPMRSLQALRKQIAYDYGTNSEEYLRIDSAIDYLKEQEPHTSISNKGIETLLDNYMYHILLTFGRDVQDNNIIKLCMDEGIDIDEQLLRASIDFAQTLYDINEQEGYNDRHYPARCKPTL